MNLIRPYEERDLMQLEQLAEKLDCQLPALGADRGGLQLVLEDSDGQAEMALVGEICFSVVPLVDPARVESRQNAENLRALLDAADRTLTQGGLGAVTVLLMVPPKARRLRRQLEQANVYPLPKGWAIHGKICGFPVPVGRQPI